MGTRAGRGTGASAGKGSREARRLGAKESLAARRERVVEIVRRLRAQYPDATCSLEHADPYQLLVATILSAQCTDERVNIVTPALFARYPAAEDLADARVEEVVDYFARRKRGGN